VNMAGPHPIQVSMPHKPSGTSLIDIRLRLLEAASFEQGPQQGAFCIFLNVGGGEVSRLTFNLNFLKSA